MGDDTEFSEILDDLASDSIKHQIDHPQIPLFAYFLDPWTNFQSSINGIPQNAHVEDGHKLVVQDLDIEYNYGLQPERINGVWWYKYGIDATNNKEDYEGIIMHHTTIAAPLDNVWEYTQKQQSSGGTFGYHFLIGRDGRIIQAAPLNKRTNHCKDHDDYPQKRYAQTHLNKPNTCSVSLYGGYRPVNGGYQYVPPTTIQVSNAKSILLSLKHVYQIDLGEVWGHGEIQNDRMIQEGRVVARWARSL